MGESLVPQASAKEDDEPIDPFAPAPRVGDPLLVPGKEFDRGYRVDAIIGDGGTGIVASATHATLGRVALKLLRREHASVTSVVERFLVEARLVAKVRSAHVVTVHEVATAPDGRPYFSMELLSGKDLGTVLDERGRLDVDESIRWAIEACDGLAEVHALGLVHRDIKPENLFLAEADGTPTTLKLVDFGVVRVLDEAARAELGVKATEGIVGTPRYMAPEQIQEDLVVDGRADLWALGVVLYEMLTGVCVFEGKSFVDTLRNVLLRDPPPPSTHRQEVSRELDAIVLRCLRRPAGERFGSAAELAEALEALRGARPRDSFRTPVPLPVSTPPPRASRPSRPSAPPRPAPSIAPPASQPLASVGPVGRTVQPDAPRARRLVAALAVLAAALTVTLAYVFFNQQPPRSAAAPTPPESSSSPSSAPVSSSASSSSPVSSSASSSALSTSPSASAVPAPSLSVSSSSAPKRPPPRTRRDPSTVQ